jgi:hypothetical protein
VRRDGLEEVVVDDEERRMAGNGAATGFTVATPLGEWGEGVEGAGE